MSDVIKPHLYVTRRIPDQARSMLEEKCIITEWPSDEVVSRDEILQQVKGIDALFCLLTDKIDKDVLDAAGPSLRVVSTMSVGYDHIDITECKKRGIPVGYTPDVLTDATAELTVTLLLATSRRLIEGVNAVKSGEWGTWKPLWLCGQGLQSSTVGIVGLGRIGMAVAERLKPHKVSRFLYCNNNPHPKAADVKAEFVPFCQLLQKSDFVIVCCALTPETKDMFNKNSFKQMKKSAIFINTSRGGVVNQDDLYNALKSGDISAAGLDVTTPEPLPVDSPLLSLNNCIILPHIGSATNEARAAMSCLTAQNILSVLNGEEMPCQVNI